MLALTRPPPAHADAPAPHCSVSGISNPATDALLPMWNEPFTVSIAFDNSGNATGYMPYVDLFIPTGYALDPAHAISMNGYPVTTYIPALGLTGHWTHPLTGADVYDASLVGKTFVVARLATGQIPASAAPFTLSVPLVFTAGSSPLTTPPSPAPPLVTDALNYQCVFWFGNSPLQASPIPSGLTGLTQARVTPQVVKIWKTLDSDKVRVAGPIDTNRWQLHIDIATGITLSNLVVRDALQATHKTLGMTLTGQGPSTYAFRVDGATPVTYPFTGGNAEVAITSFIGHAGADLLWEIEGYYDDHALDDLRASDPLCGYDATAQGNGGHYFARTNLAEVEAGTLAIDPSSARIFAGPLANSQLDVTNAAIDRTPALTCQVSATPAVGCPTPSQMQSNALAYNVAPIGIRESIANLSANTGTSARPGDTMRVTVRLRQSDYFDFHAVTVTSQLPDGLTPVTSLRNGSTRDGWYGVSGASQDGVDATRTHNADGTWTVTWSLGNLVRNAQSPQGALMALQFDVKIDQAYENRFYPSTSTPRPVSAGDGLHTVQSLSAQVANPGRSECGFDDTVSGMGLSTDSEGDEDIQILPVSLGKKIIRIRRHEDFTHPIENANGLTNVTLSPGDLVTYQLSAQVPSGDTTYVTLTDLLPTPKHYATEHSAQDLIPPATASADPNDAAYAPVRWGAEMAAGLMADGDEYDGPITVAISPFEYNNSVTWTWNHITNSDEPDPNRKIVLEYDARVLPVRSADNLELTNIFNGTSEAGSNLTVVDMRVLEPAIVLKKGVVGVSTGYVNGKPSYDLGLHAGFTKNGSGDLVYSVTDATQVDGDWHDLDAGDIVTYAIAVTNIGHAPAFELHLTDLAPANPALVTPAGGHNLRITSGASATSVTATHSAAAAPYFPDTVSDELVFSGLLGQDKCTASGGNLQDCVIVILMDWQIDGSATPADQYVNRATVEASYSMPLAKVQGLVAQINSAYPAEAPLVTLADFDLNHGPLSDDAAIDLRDLALAKALDVNAAGYSAITQIGDRVPFAVTLTVPEGTVSGAPFGNLVLSDTLSGAVTALVGAPTVDVDAGIAAVYHADNAGDPTDWGSTATAPHAASATLTQWGFDSLTNSASDLDAETIVYHVVAEARDTTTGTHGHDVCNSANIAFAGTSVTTAEVCQAIIDPHLTRSSCDGTVNVTAATTRQLSYQFRNDRDAGSTAYRAVWTLTLPSGVTLHDTNGGGADGTDLTVTTPTGGTVTARSSTGQVLEVDIDKIAYGAGVATVTFSVDISATAPHGAQYTLVPDLAWDSQPSAANGGNPTYHKAYGSADGCSTTLVVAAPTIAKALEVPTTTTYAPGDSFYYTIDVPVPVGVSSSLAIKDDLPTKLVFVSAAGSDFAVKSGILCGGATCTLPSGPPSPGDDPATWTFNTVSNSDTDAEVEDLFWKIKVRVASTGTAGTTLQNTATLTRNGNSATNLNVSAATVRVVEPAVTVAVANDTPIVNGLSTPTFTVTTTNSNGTNASPAYEVTATLDLTAANMPFSIPNGTSVTYPAGQTGCTLSTAVSPNPSVGTNSVTVVWQSLIKGKACGFKVQTATSDTIKLGGLTTDVPARVTYSSIAYADTDDWSSRHTYVPADVTCSATSATPTIDKTFVSTNSTETSGEKIAIGEQVTYRLRIDMPVGVLNNARIVDVGAGLTLTSASLAAGGNPGGFSLPSSLPIATSANTIKIDLYQTSASQQFTNADNGQTNDDYILIDVVATGTFSLTALPTTPNNVATLKRDSTTTVDGTTVVSDTYPIDFAVPQPRLTLAADDTNPFVTNEARPEEGDTVTLTATLVNNGDGPICARAGSPPTVIQIAWPTATPQNFTLNATATDGLDNDGDGSTDEGDEASFGINATTLEVPLLNALGSGNCLAPGAQRLIRLAMTTVDITPGATVTATAKLTKYNTLPSGAGGTDYEPKADGYDNENDGAIDDSGEDNATVDFFVVDDCGDGNIDLDKGEECDPNAPLFAASSHCSSTCLIQNFGACDSAVRVARGRTQGDLTQVALLDRSTTPYAFGATLATIGAEVHALAFNPKTGFYYGVNTNGEIVRVAPGDGTVKNLGCPKNAGTTDCLTAARAGAFRADGTYAVSETGSGRQIVRLDVQSDFQAVAFLGSPVTTSADVTAMAFAPNDTNGNLRLLGFIQAASPATHELAQIALPGGSSATLTMLSTALSGANPPLSNVAGMYFDADPNHLFLYGTPSGSGFDATRLITIDLTPGQGGAVSGAAVVLSEGPSGIHVGGVAGCAERIGVTTVFDVYDVMRSTYVEATYHLANSTGTTQTLDFDAIAPTQLAGAVVFPFEQGTLAITGTASPGTTSWPEANHLHLEDIVIPADTTVTVVVRFDVPSGAVAGTVAMRPTLSGVASDWPPSPAYQDATPLTIHDFAGADDTFYTLMDVALDRTFADLTANDTSGDAASVTIAATKTARGGAVTVNAQAQTWHYVPASHDYTDDAFGYRVCALYRPFPCTDVNVKVVLNPPPVATNFETWVFVGTPQVEVDLAALFEDPDDDELDEAGATYPVHTGGSGTISSSILTVTPTNPNAVGTVHLVVHLCDLDAHNVGCTTPDADVLVHLYDCMPIYAVVSNSEGAPVGTVSCQICSDNQVDCDKDDHGVAIVDPTPVCPAFAGEGN